MVISTVGNPIDILVGCYTVILSWHLVLSTAAKISPDMQIRRLSDMKCSSRNLFGFLSDKTLLECAGAYGGKPHMRFVPVVITFQKLSGFPETTYSAADATKAFEESPFSFSCSTNTKALVTVMAILTSAAKV